MYGTPLNTGTTPGTASLGLKLSPKLARNVSISGAPSVRVSGGATFAMRGGRAHARLAPAPRCVRVVRARGRQAHASVHATIATRAAAIPLHFALWRAWPTSALRSVAHIARLLEALQQCAVASFTRIARALVEARSARRAAIGAEAELMVDTDVAAAAAVAERAAARVEQLRELRVASDASPARIQLAEQRAAATLLEHARGVEQLGCALDVLASRRRHAGASCRG